MVRGMVKRLLTRALWAGVLLVLLLAVSCISWDKTVFRCNKDTDCPAGQTCDQRIHWCSPPHDVIITDIQTDTTGSQHDASSSDRMPSPGVK